MIKYFCDRCGKEVDGTNHTPETALWNVECLKVCDTCKAEHDELQRKAAKAWVRGE